MKRLIIGVCSVVVALGIALFVKSNNCEKQSDLFADNVEALTWSEQIFVGMPCGWAPDHKCWYRSDRGERYSADGYFTPWGY